MKRLVLAITLAVVLATAPAAADDLTGRTGFGEQFGIQKLVGGDRDYANVDQNFGLWLRHGFSPRWSVEAGADYGWIRPGALPDQDAGFTFDSVHAFYTTMLTGFAGARFHFAPARKFGPYAGARLGLMSWQVRNENGTGDFGFFPGGPTVSGYDKHGNPVLLEDTNLVGALTLGAEWFLSGSLSMDLGVRYNLIFGNDRDNVGTSALWGPDHADVNSGRWDFFLGGTIYFGGSKDKDKDGIENELDNCPEAAEDFDGYRDQDGCPDWDNDADGIMDIDDNCPDDAEDIDGYRDADGCPDPDNDGDGVIDLYDMCPEKAEDLDGFNDTDGCPDPDNDGDGVLDAADVCPATPVGVTVGADGCPTVAELTHQVVLTGVSFGLNSADLTVESFAVLDKIAESLAAYPGIRVEVQGHTDSTGTAVANLDISSRRAAAVKEYLIEQGIAPSRMVAVGYGEDLPIADNGTPAGRAANRRVELVRIN